MPSADLSSLPDLLRVRARELGFQHIGIAPAVRVAGFDRLQKWLAAGYAADMSWIERRLAAYESPAGVLPSARSVIVAAMNYHDGSTSADSGRVARYARGAVDYHDLLRTRLRKLADALHTFAPGCRSRCVVDTAPLLERDFARLAGIGWFGKNTMLISPRSGSWFFLGAVITDVELPGDAEFDTDHCGTCTRCLDACPTGAFPEPGVLDANRCISYLTIERRDQPIPIELRPGIGEWVFGCDVCQDVCPWNRFAPTAADPALCGIEHMNPVDCCELLTLDALQFSNRFQGTALLRPGRAGILRNAAIVLGNRRDPLAEAALVTALSDVEPLIRGAAAWALGQLKTPTAIGALRERCENETDLLVLDEINGAIQSFTD